jgi:uncharacterized membrane protein YgdD (TMEM256/DUF423 family)
MSAPSTLPGKISALLGALGVALGAFGAHGLKTVLENNQTLSVWQTASQYHLLHAVVLLCLSWKKSPPAGAFWAMTLGVLVFSGSLYALSVTGIRKLGMITPLGGVLLIAGWLLLLKPPPSSGPAPET